MKDFNKVWLEGGRSYKLQLLSYEDDIFLMCSVLCAEAKGLSWFFLKERVCKEGRGGGGC